MILNTNKITNINEVVLFWAKCLRELPKSDNTKVAYDMVRVAACDEWTSWYNEGKGDQLLVETFNFLTDLETPFERELSREEMWLKVKQNVVVLQQKYPKE